jgi:DNA-directed RNA polymerase subunit delta
MYERSAIVLEKNFNTILGFDKKPNLKTIYKDYKEITEEIQKYQSILEEEDKVINEFDETANEIRKIQQEQKKLYKSNIKLEEDRNQLFDNLEDEPEVIEKKLLKIETTVSENNQKLEEIREKYIKTITEFEQKQQDRNACSKDKRAEEKKHLQLIEKITNDFKEIDKEMVKNIKTFISTDEEAVKTNIIEIMIENGKDERIPFNKAIIENAVNTRITIARREAECYMAIFEKTRRLLTELNNDDIKMDKYNKTLRDVSAKLAFLKAMKLYIVSFLDNERMSTINGIKIHNKLMEEACENFTADMEQVRKLYELIIREITNKSSKKAYKELYNKEYLKNIEDKEKNFEEEVNNIRVNAGAIINSNYWRIEEIKNIYDVFQNEVTQKFGKDLSEFQPQEENEEEIEEKTEIEDDIFKTKISDEDTEYVEEFEFDDDDEYDEADNEKEYYEDEEECEDEDDEEYEDDYEEDEEYEDEYDDNFEDDDQYEDDGEEFDDEYEDEYEDDEDEYDDEYEDEYDDEDENDEDEEIEEDDEKIEKTDSNKKENTKSNSKKGIFNKFFKDKRS